MLPILSCIVYFTSGRRGYIMPDQWPRRPDLSDPQLLRKRVSRCKTPPLWIILQGVFEAQSINHLLTEDKKCIASHVICSLLMEWSSPLLSRAMVVVGGAQEQNPENCVLKRENERMLRRRGLEITIHGEPTARLEMTAMRDYVQLWQHYIQDSIYSYTMNLSHHPTTRSPHLRS